MNLSFRNRIALFNTLAVAVTTALVFFVIYFVVNRTAYIRLDDDIILEKDEVFGSLEWHNDSIVIAKMPEWDEAEHEKIEVNPTFLQLVDMEGKVIFHSTNLLNDRFPFNPHNEKDFFYNSEISKQKIRIGQFAVKNEKGKIIGQLTIAISQQESYTMLSNLLLVLFISFPLVLIAQFVASSVAAGRSIQPVHQLINTASGINSSNIGTRIVMPVHKDELYELAKTINALLDRIETSMIQQKQFTSDASHEIRTPLAAIRGTLEVLLRRPREQNVYEEKISDSISQVDRLNSLIDQLLQLARIESGVVAAKAEPVNLSDIVTALIEKWKFQASENEIDIQVHMVDQAIVTGDKIYLELIIDNLVNNAIKYGRQNGNVILQWHKTSGILTVKDDGQGIPADQLPNIYNRFYRVDESRNSARKGSGLGLSIVKKLAELQNITISAESQSGVGSTFRLQFPL